MKPELKNLLKLVVAIVFALLGAFAVHDSQSKTFFYILSAYSFGSWIVQR